MQYVKWISIVFLSLLAGLLAIPKFGITGFFLSFAVIGIGLANLPVLAAIGIDLFSELFVGVILPLTTMGMFIWIIFFLDWNK